MATTMAEWIATCNAQEPCTVLASGRACLTFNGRNELEAQAVKYTQRGEERVILNARLSDKLLSLKKRNRIVWRFPNDARDWYIAAYTTDAAIQHSASTVHPFGHTVILMPWSLPDAIDKYGKPYTRKAATFTPAS